MMSLNEEEISVSYVCNPINIGYKYQFYALQSGDGFTVSTLVHLLAYETPNLLDCHC
ncbi:hypothetical protein GI584_02290 [Gracilibacillus salitolerans]|uniref:Uncharacterized protein n=1 Tax=Gracilibacillus salitolerans TaxID=2663022 RepID=A0A5Q2THR2_9BACI|nr:hypothetical protein GI584_02290 [Gracilibacillus salitolerans]